jgi:hypothetical protein
MAYLSPVITKATVKDFLKPTIHGSKISKRLNGLNDKAPIDLQ